MSVVINTNMSAIMAATNLSNANAHLQTSIQELSSGSKLTSPGQDPGGLAVSMKLTSEVNRSNDTADNVADATSFLQTQDGALSTVGSILDQISQIQTLAKDPTKSASDVADYDTEFTALQGEITTLGASTFNGISLFGSAANQTLAVSTTEDGSSVGTVGITQSNLIADTGVAAILSASSLSSLSSSQTSTAITDVSSMLAQNGADTDRLQFASQMLSVNTNNLTSANSTLSDVDVASESTKLAQYNITVQAATSMLAQANSSPQSVLKLLQ
jgi:flagellin